MRPGVVQQDKKGPSFDARAFIKHPIRIDEGLAANIADASICNHTLARTPSLGHAQLYPSPYTGLKLDSPQNAKKC